MEMIGKDLWDCMHPKQAIAAAVKAMHNVQCARDTQL